MKIVPTVEGLTFRGFELSGRVPESVLEWSHATIAMAHFIVSAEDLLIASPMFVSLQEVRSSSNVFIEIPVVAIGIENAERSAFGSFPLGAAVFHVENNMAKAAMLIPGVPQAGLGHSGIYTKVDTMGRVHKLAADDDVNLQEDVDIAVLAEMFLAT